MRVDFSKFKSPTAVFFTTESGSALRKLLDPDPQKMNADPHVYNKWGVPVPPGVDEVALHGDPVGHADQGIRHQVTVDAVQLHACNQFPQVFLMLKTINQLF